MALNVHLQMYHKETGIITASNKYALRVGRYHCPIENCTFRCYCEKNIIPSLSFATLFTTTWSEKERCSKCLKSFGLHQDFIAHEKICGIHCPFSCPNCEQQFRNRTSLRRHQLKYHIERNNDSQNNLFSANPPPPPPPLSKPNERRKRPARRRPLPFDQIELSRQNIPSLSRSSVTINPMALALLKNFNSEPTSIFESDQNKATQTNTNVSVGTDCCSFNVPCSISMKTTEQKSSQTTSRLRMYNNSTSSTNRSSTSHWKNIHVQDMETQIASPLRSDAYIQTVGDVSNLLDYPSESSANNHNAIVQTLPIPMTSTQIQTMNEYNNYSLLNHESVGTSCFFDDFILGDLSKNDDNDLTSSVLFDFDAIDLLDLIDSETQTVIDWNNMLLTEDEWIQTIMNS